MTLEWRCCEAGEWKYSVNGNVVGEVWQTPCRYYWFTDASDGYAHTLRFGQEMVERMVRSVR